MLSPIRGVGVVPVMSELLVELHLKTFGWNFPIDHSSRDLFALEISFGDFRLGACVLECSRGKVRLEAFVWEYLLGASNVETFVSERWLENVRL